MADLATKEVVFTVNNFIPKLIVLGLLATAGYYIVICPCKTLVACHYHVVVTSLSGALATIMIANIKK